MLAVCKRGAVIANRSVVLCRLIGAVCMLASEELANFGDVAHAAFASVFAEHKAGIDR
jgi:hypothetical protein